MAGSLKDIVLLFLEGVDLLVHQVDQLANGLHIGQEGVRLGGLAKFASIEGGIGGGIIPSLWDRWAGMGRCGRVSTRPSPGGFGVRMCALKAVQGGTYQPDGGHQIAHCVSCAVQAAVAAQQRRPAAWASGSGGGEGQEGGPGRRHRWGREERLREADRWEVGVGEMLFLPALTPGICLSSTQGNSHPLGPEEPWQVRRARLVIPSHSPPDPLSLSLAPALQLRVAPSLARRESRGLQDPDHLHTPSG